MLYNQPHTGGSVVEHQAVMRKVAGLNTGHINTQDLKIIEQRRKSCLFNFIANDETFKSSRIRTA